MVWFVRSNLEALPRRWDRATPKRCAVSAEAPMMDNRLVRDPFDVLGIERNVSYSEAQRVYKRRVRLLHPDRVMDDPELNAEATRLTAELNDAWACIKNTIERAQSGEPATAGTPEGGSSRQSQTPPPKRDPGPQSGANSFDDDSAQDVLDWMIGGIIATAGGIGAGLRHEDLHVLGRPMTNALSKRSTNDVRLRARRVVTDALEADVRAGSTVVPVPSGIKAPRDWWNAYVRLGELGDDSLLVFVLDDILDPDARGGAA